MVAGLRFLEVEVGSLPILVSLQGSTFSSSCLTPEQLKPLKLIVSDLGNQNRPTSWREISRHQNSGTCC